MTKTRTTILALVVLSQVFYVKYVILPQWHPDKHTEPSMLDAVELAQATTIEAENLVRQMQGINKRQEELHAKDVNFLQNDAFYNYALFCGVCTNFVTNGASMVISNKTTL